MFGLGQHTEIEMEQSIEVVKPRRSRKGEAALTPAREKRKRSPEPKPSKLALKALQLMNAGEARTVTRAAEILGCSREGLSRALNKPAVKAHIVATARLELVGAVGYAMRRKLELLDATSEKVRSQVTSEVIAMGAGIMQPRAPLVAVQNNTYQGPSGCTLYSIDDAAEKLGAIGAQTPGYVINLTGRSTRELADEVAGVTTAVELESGG